jgi:hypothetical protein
MHGDEILVQNQGTVASRGTRLAVNGIRGFSVTEIPDSQGVGTVGSLGHKRLQVRRVSETRL